MADSKTVMALDIGSKRIGVALASLDALIARPLLTIDRTSVDVFETLTRLINDHSVDRLVCGQPRGLDGQETQQTRDTLDFIHSLEGKFQIPLVLQDEALTSKQAEAELEKRGKPYKKSDVDALAATYILDDYLQKALGDRN